MRTIAAARTRMREVLEDFGGATSLTCGAEAAESLDAAADADAAGADAEVAEWRPLDGSAGKLVADGTPSSNAGRTAERPESVSRLRRFSSERISAAPW